MRNWSLGPVNAMSSSSRGRRRFAVDPSQARAQNYQLRLATADADSTQSALVVTDREWLAEHQKARQWLEQEALRVFGIETAVEFVDHRDKERIPPDYVVARVVVAGGDVASLLDGEEKLAALLIESFPDVADGFVVICSRLRA